MSRRSPSRPLLLPPHNTAPLRSPTISRRRLLLGLGASTLPILAGAAPFILRGDAWGQSPEPLIFKTDPFKLGVASGDPDSTSVVLWTRLAPEPLTIGGGLPPLLKNGGPVAVDWEVGLNEQMTRVMFRGTVMARPETGYSVHALAQGLLPGRHYWYRFRAGEAESRIGRTRILPARSSNGGDAAQRFQIAIASCQRIEHGHFTAWADIAQRDLDMVLHLGDYIYEYALKPDVIARRMGFALPANALRKLASVNDYRLRHALYKLDPNLADAHAAHPFVVSYDDHETVNNWAGDTAPNMSAADLRKLRAAAFQAYYENMPVRAALQPQGPAMRAYRSFEVGDLLRIASLDTRQYRTPHACGRGDKMPCDERLESGRTILGAEQESWLLDQLGRGDTAWNLLGNQVMMMQCRYKEPALDIVDTDKWDGYAAARERLFDGIAARKTKGLVVATGDIHRAFAGDLKTDFDKPESPTLGAEFICSSIASNGDGSAGTVTSAKLRGANDHIKFYDGRRGYTVLDFDRKRCEARYQAVAKVSVPGAKVSTIKTLTVEAGKPGIA
jgi:alkaline phosphatase D